MTLRAWTRGPFELIVHGELHYRTGDDFDRRVALISFDNAIEVSITNYLSLNPIHRGGRQYDGADVSKWTRNFHTKIDFMRTECSRRGICEAHEKEDLVWYHQQRNEQYHRGTYAAPNLDILIALRSASLWVFSTLYEVPEIEKVLEDELSKFLPNPPSHSRSDDYDQVIDQSYDPVELPTGPVAMSELLFLTDPTAYVEIALELLETATSPIRVVS